MSIQSLFLLVMCMYTLLVGCAPGGASVAPSIAPSAHPSPYEARSFEIVQHTVQGRVLPLPLVRVKIGSASTLMLIDSGSTHHVLTTAFATSHGLDVSARVEQGRDHSGGQLSLQNMGEVEVEVDGISLQLKDTLVMQGPAAFESLGIGGILSPQHMSERGVVVLDFVRGVGTLYPEVADGDEIMRTHHASFEEAASAPFKGMYVVVALDTHAPLIAYLDTGGTTSEFLASMMAVDVGAHHEGGVAMSERLIAGKKVPGRRIHIAGAIHENVTVLAVDEHAFFKKDPRAEALVGMDVLRHCVVMLPQQDRAVARFLCKSPLR